MTTYLLRRLGLVTLLIFVAVVFVGLQLLLPFDFSTQFAFGGRGDDYYAIRESLGLDRPPLARVGLYMVGLIQGDLGMSYTGEPVAAVIGRSSRSRSSCSLSAGSSHMSWGSGWGGSLPGIATVRSGRPPPPPACSSRPCSLRYSSS